VMWLSIGTGGGRLWMMRINARYFESILQSLKAVLAYLNLSFSVYLKGPEAESSPHRAERCAHAESTILLH
jgi:hypothetical protein